jgi:hypothetical protein
VRGFFLLSPIFYSIVIGFIFTKSIRADEPWKNLFQEALSKHLDQDPQWLHLLHYHRHHGRMESDIDGGYFFLSSSGKTDSKAELEATIKSLLSVVDLSPPMPKGMENTGMHPLVKFRARLHFLQDRLQFSDSLLPKIDCHRFFKWRSSLKPVGATLVFASSYLNNPASTFGHTFLRLNTFASETDRSILNYGITYSAAVPAGAGISFLYNGVFGKYPGTFGIVPYFVSLQKYSNLESRDIWEYDLKLDSNQINYLLEHVWEVGACWMKYYFFDENCSYNIITLLDAISPNLDLANQLDGAVVIPSETVKTLLNKQGLIGASLWRPSILTTFRLRTASLGTPQKKYLRQLILEGGDKIASGPQPFSPDTVSSLLDIALDYVQYSKRRAKPKAASIWAKRQRSLLLARAARPPSESIFPVIAVQKATAPEAGHGGHLVNLAVGNQGYHPYLELGYRLAYHDLNAAENGFLAGSQIEAGKIRLRVYCDENCREGYDKIEVHTLDILNIVSITPIDFIRRPWSWAMRLGYESRPEGSFKPGGSALVEGGAGLAAAWHGPVALNPYFLGQARISSVLADQGRPDLGPQIKLGSRFGFGTKASIWVENRTYFSLLEDQHWEIDAFMDIRYSLGKNADLRLLLSSQDRVGESTLTWNKYF